MTVELRIRIDADAIDGGQYIASLKDIREAALRKDLTSEALMLNGSLIHILNSEEALFFRSQGL